MGIVNSALIGASGQAGYNISNSLRFTFSASTHLTRTPAVAGNRKTWTWSGWVKHTRLGSINGIFSAGTGADTNNRMTINIASLNSLVINYTVAGVTTGLTTNQVFRDPAAWYHITIVFDTTQSTASDRLKIYINNRQITDFSVAAYVAQDTEGFINNTIVHQIGRPYSANAYHDGYMADINFVDGQALTPSSFGETNIVTGQWIAKKYTGSYGVNGFYLPFTDGTDTTTLGADSSGNGNNWTLNGFTRSAGVNDCWMIDVPSGNGSQVGGTQPNSNYCTFNSVVYNAGSVSYNNGSLTALMSGSIDRFNIGSIAARSGKYYWEVTLAGISASSNVGIGICKETQGANGPWIGFGGPETIYFNTSDGWAVYGSSTGGATGTFANNDVLGVAVDFDTNIISIYDNGTLVSSKYGVIDTTVGHTVFVNTYVSGSSANLNCGQRSFAYTPPTGFRALCTANLSEATIKKGNQFMDATTYTGNGGTLSVVNAGSFSPDLVWVKDRSAGQANRLFDTVRGATIFLSSNTTDAEVTNSVSLTSFNSNGFTLDSGAVQNNLNNSFVAWQWDAGSSTVTNTNGTISSQVRANPTAGMSIATFTAGSGNYTVGHGLGVAPSMTIVKRRDSATGGSWWTWHIGLGNNTTDYLELNSTAAEGSVANMWGSVGRNSTVSGFNGTASTVAGGTFVMYNFSEIAGFSRFGSYTGNGSADGPFVYTGFRPKFIMTKRTDSATNANWVIHDTTRSPHNVAGKALFPNLSNAEDNNEPAAQFDILSNGFKLRSSSDVYNGSSATYIYACFAESPFASSNAR
jgi:hypothetical protein